MDFLVEASDFGQEIKFPFDDTPYPNYKNVFIKSSKDYEKVANMKVFDPRNPKEAPRMSFLIEVIKKLKAWNPDVFVIGFVYCAFGVLANLRVGEKLISECEIYKKEIHEALKTINKILNEYTKAQLEAGADAICLNTSFCSHTSMTKQLWKEMEGEYAKEQAKIIADFRKPILVFNYRNLPYFDILEECLWIRKDIPFGILFADLPIECKTEEELKNTYGKRFTLHGHIMPSPTLFLGTPEEVKKECKSQLDIFAKGGRYILGASCEFPPNGSLLNAIAMTEAANEWSYK